VSEADRRLRELSDRLEIGDVLTRYGIAIDTRQWGLLATVFTPDALIDYSSSGGPSGRFPEIASWLERFLTPFPMNQHMTLNSHVELEGDVARARSYFFNPNSLPDESGELKMIFVGGYYDDRFERGASGWRIVERVQATSWMYSSDSPEEWAKRTGLGDHGA
jgi:hypothetical protein